MTRAGETAGEAPSDGGAVAQLARKYDALAELRQARARGEAIPPKAVFRALAQEFPGALHELDNLPLAEIERRREALRRARAGGAVEPWIAWMHSYHALMRAALYVKLRVSRRAALDGAETDVLAAKASAHAHAAVDRAFVAAVRSPPDGRLSRLVLERLSAAFAVPPGELREALFPRRPRGPG